MTDEEIDWERLSAAATTLGEHFDSVQIFATRHEGDEGTVTVAYGVGNWHARRGQIADWLVKENERTRQSVNLEEEP